jgi:carbamate kinase
VLAGDVGADVLLILTNVDGVYTGFGKPKQRLHGRLSADEAKALIDTGELGRGSMAPKVEAAVAFVRAGGGRACIGRLDQGLDVVEGSAGTTIAG